MKRARICAAYGIKNSSMATDLFSTVKYEETRCAEHFPYRCVIMNSNSLSRPA